MTSRGSPHDDQPEDMPPSSSTVPRRRGPNKLKRVQEATTCFNIDPNELGQPCNDEQEPLARFLGVLARDPNLLPLTIRDYRYVPQERKEILFARVGSQFEIEDPQMKKWVISKIGNLWRG